MVKSFENLDAILRDWAKDKVQEILAQALNRYEKHKEERWGREPLLNLEFNKANKEIVYEINLYEKCNFFSV